MGKRFAWCHDGESKNGEFSLEANDFTGGDFKKWSLQRWKVIGEHEIVVDDGNDGNKHHLVFNCEHTGFFVAGSRQRGYMEDQNFQSPSGAGAPTSADTPDCKLYDSSGRFPVWIWWDFPNSAPATFQLNMRTWRKHIPEDKFDLHLLNPSNIRKFLPGLPEGFFKLYHAAKSDFLRAGLLAAHGGVYLDGDMLIMHDLDVIVKDLLDGKVDVMPYEGPGDHCPTSYTTNFMAGSKGNRLSSEWINITVRQMMQRCKLDESQNHREPVKVCCYQQNWCLRTECHVAWGDISHPPSLNSLPKGSVRIGCIPYSAGLSYTMSGEELFWKFVREPSDKKKHCWPAGDSDLICSRPVGPLPGFFNHHGHHLYNMLNGFAMEKKTGEDILSSDLVVGELYRRSLGLPT